ncbi:MAG: acetate--CoA ligase family protein [Candidatus Micrarchaeota archaeon]|nr:acetate--CoA ligase family protein [Candidatus Micrarchaeota archaeon]
MRQFDLSSKYEIPVVEYAIAKSADEAQRIADSIGYPVAMKIASSQPIHKTEIGGVRLNIPHDAVQQTFNDLLRTSISAGIEFEGVIIQQMAKPGIEMIVGMKHDQTFGPIIVVGAGGIYAEILKDVAIRVCPIDREDAKEMVMELKSYQIFKARGKEYDLDALINTILKVNSIALTEKIKELDLNPVIVHSKESGGGCEVVDIRVIE